MMNDKDWEIAVVCLPEGIPVKWNALASGDDEADREVEREIIERLEAGDIWAWCSVVVEARHRDFPRVCGVDVLGGCSYEDEGAFRRDGYYEDMVREAKGDCIAEAQALIDKAARMAEVLA